MNKKTLKIYTAAAALAIGTGAAFGQGGMPPMVVGTSTVKTIETNPVRKYNGHIMAMETVAIVPQVAGEIKAVHFKEGATVKAGDLLYTIDKVKYEAAAASARATVAQAKASAEYAGKTFDRVKTLFDKKVASDDDMDSATSAKNTADAALAAAEAALVAAEDNLAHCSIVAPISGKIGMNKATVGNYVTTASGALTTIVESDPARLVFSMSARDFLASYGGEKGLREHFVAKILMADGSEYAATPEFDFTDNTANAATDTITLYFTIANADGILMAGMSVKVFVSAKEAAEVVAVPVTAVIHNADGAFVYVMGEGGIPQRREIEVAGVTAEYEIVKSGLAVGETIVSRGTHKVFPGAPVTPVPVAID